eukprot:357945-Chlamydomonas_euryale.AAC.3
MRITYVPMYAFTPEAREKMVAMEKAMPPEQTTEMSKEAPMLMQTMVRGTQMKRLAKKGDIRAAAQSQMEEMQNAIGQGIKDFMKKTGQVPPVEQFNSPWAVLAEQVAETCAGLEPRAFVENHQSDTQVGGRTQVCSASGPRAVDRATERSAATASVLCAVFCLLWPQFACSGHTLPAAATSHSQDAC